MSPLPYQFHPEAEAEFLAAIDWYAERDADVATDFAVLVRDAVQLIAELPQAWPTWRNREDLRVRVLRRFPFSIIYAVEADLLVIIAVAHHRRRPGYWLHRAPR
ncbi:MAG TPA: type II toxin-antitoxin system RelE/ParE family toxin [Kofleriaceae bacterium]|nr:type II toxin-antitoxin system RelE/ParE family toxin [Kofleriaceae bacterium]